MKKNEHDKYYEAKAKIAYELYCENKPFVKVYSIVQNGDKFFVLKNSKETAKYKYDLAGGGVDPGEDIETATKREVLEELNIVVKFVRDVDVLHYVRTWRYQGKEFDVNYEAHVVLSEYVSQNPNKKIGLKGEFDNNISVAEISKKEMLENVAEFVSFNVKF